MKICNLKGGLLSGGLTYLDNNKYKVIDYKSFYLIELYHFARDASVD